MSVAIKLDAETKSRLKVLGEKRERSPHWLMKKAIAEFLEREEAFERDKAEDERRWQEYQKTGETIPHEEVLAWLKENIRSAETVE